MGLLKRIYEVYNEIIFKDGNTYIIEIVSACLNLNSFMYTHFFFPHLEKYFPYSKKKFHMKMLINI